MTRLDKIRKFTLKLFVHPIFPSYKCDCDETGFVGSHCEEDIPECASDPCQHGATCLERVNHYMCLCWPGNLNFVAQLLPQPITVYCLEIPN